MEFFLSILLTALGMLLVVVLGVLLLPGRSEQSEEFSELLDEDVPQE